MRGLKEFLGCSGNLRWAEQALQKFGLCSTFWSPSWLWSRGTLWLCGPCACPDLVSPQSQQARHGVEIQRKGVHFPHPPALPRRKSLVALGRPRECDLEHQFGIFFVAWGWERESVHPTRFPTAGRTCNPFSQREQIPLNFSFLCTACK